MSASGLVPPQITDMMGSTISYKNRSGLDRYGKPTYGVAVTGVRCMIQPSSNVVRRDDGTEVNIRWMVYIDDVDITPDAEITLPDTTTPLMVQLDTFYDENGSKVYQVASLA